MKDCFKLFIHLIENGESERWWLTVHKERLSVMMNSNISLNHSDQWFAAKYIYNTALCCQSLVLHHLGKTSLSFPPPPPISLQEPLFLVMQTTIKKAMTCRKDQSSICKERHCVIAKHEKKINLKSLCDKICHQHINK